MTFGTLIATTAAAATALPRDSMRALVRGAGSTSVQTLPKPKLTDASSVIVRVTLAGLCRTDLYAAEGKIKIPEPMVLGHEFSGVVDAVGGDVEALRVGQRVTVNPLLPCRTCRHCSTGASDTCQKSNFIGIDLPGCFAGYICVPASAVYALPDSVSDLAAAYAEPVAASLAVLKAGLKRNERGMIYGKNRFSQLLQQILKVHGIDDVHIHDPANPVEPNAFDYVIETMMTSQTFADVTEAVRPGGKIVLKSRQHQPIQFVMTELLRKEPVMHVVNYGSFEDALALLVSGKVLVDDLVDGIYSLDQFQSVLNKAREQEALKPFFAPWQG